MSRLLVIPDTHFPDVRRGAFEFLERTATKYKIDRVAHIGDLVSWSSISYFEKHPNLSNPTREFEKAKRQVAKLTKLFPKADLLLGNHDCLTERQAASVGLPPEVLRSFNDLWGIKWRVHPRFSKLVVDGVVLQHGDGGKGGQDAALSQAKENFRSTCIGHFHSQAGIKWWGNNHTLIFGMCVGCLIDRHAIGFAYEKPFAAKPLLGAGVILNGEQPIWIPWRLPTKS